ncbi:MAG: HVA1 family protein [Candidatus Obscuribacterales bacterium]|nr:HVA1 family protein [Candidatus Obscuribacterales bacterium]
MPRPALVCRKRSHKVDAPKENLEYLVENDKTGAKAAHKTSLTEENKVKG